MVEQLYNLKQKSKTCKVNACKVNWQKNSIEQHYSFCFYRLAGTTDCAVKVVVVGACQRDERGGAHLKQSTS
jgi:hypothetical protein